MAEIQMNAIKPDSIESVLDDFRRGKMVILVDDEDRENEGDLLVAAECVSAEHINFMASNGRGLICLTLSEERCKQLDLPLMVSRNHARFATNFTVSIEAARGVTTGISAQDRAITVRAAVRKGAAPDDLVTPGHIFPIKAQPGGVLTRAGHTEAGSDLARICGFEPASVICEILNPDGRMARLPDLVEFGRAHGIRIGAIADLIRYRMKNEPTVERIASSHLQLKAGRFQSHIYRDMVEGGVHLALVHGNIDAARPTPVRVHVHRGLLDILLQPAPSWSWPLEKVLQTIASLRCGVVVVLSYDEPASDIAARIAARQSARMETRARAAQNSPANLRMLGAGGQILADLNVGKVLALGREKRAHGLSGFGLEIAAYIAAPEQLAEWLRAHD
ncbi:MAG: 3,4-dihydroxy-2-butanone-4-phosphate synthase [Gammaproteobacteria bacterium]